MPAAAKGTLLSATSKAACRQQLQRAMRAPEAQEPAGTSAIVAFRLLGNLCAIRDTAWAQLLGAHQHALHG